MYNCCKNGEKFSSDFIYKLGQNTFCRTGFLGTVMITPGDDFTFTEDSKERKSYPEVHTLVDLFNAGQVYCKDGVCFSRWFDDILLTGEQAAELYIDTRKIFGTCDTYYSANKLAAPFVILQSPTQQFDTFGLYDVDTLELLSECEIEHLLSINDGYDAATMIAKARRASYEHVCLTSIAAD